jgi:hypothetical protein
VTLPIEIRARRELGSIADINHRLMLIATADSESTQPAFSYRRDNGRSDRLGILSGIVF